MDHLHKGLETHGQPLRDLAVRTALKADEVDADLSKVPLYTKLSLQGPSVEPYNLIKVLSNRYLDRISHEEVNNREVDEAGQGKVSWQSSIDLCANGPGCHHCMTCVGSCCQGIDSLSLCIYHWRSLSDVTQLASYRPRNGTSAL